MKTFAERLKYYMDEAGMKQTELVEKSQISKSTISEYLSGSYEPKQRNIYKLAVALGIKPSQLMGISEPAGTSGPRIVKMPPIELNQPERELITKYRRLDDDGKDRINRQVDFELYQLEKSAQKRRGELRIIYFNK